MEAEALVPGSAVFAFQHFGQLRGRHHVGLVAQASQQFGEVRRQHAVAVHGQQLPHLHHPAAHLRQTLGQPARVARGQHQLRQGGAFSAREARHAFGRGAGRHLAHGAAEMQQAAGAALGHGSGAWAVRGCSHGLPHCTTAP